MTVGAQPSNEDNELVGDTDGQGFGIGVVSAVEPLGVFCIEVCYYRHQLQPNRMYLQ